MKRRGPKRSGPKPPFSSSPAHEAALRRGHEAIRQFNATRHLLPRCGAKCRTTGEPCRNLPLANGRCRLHGGRVPKGDDWHRHKPAGSPERTNRKIANMLRAKRKRAARIAKMTPEERAAHEAWQRTHRPGKAASRASERERRRRDREAVEMVREPQTAPEPTPEAREIAAAIEQLQAELAAKRDETHGEGVFG